MQDDGGKFRVRKISRFQRLFYGCKAKCTLGNGISSLSRFIPIVDWLPKYNWQNSFFGDLSGGLSMAVFTVPQAIAQAAVTGVDPVYGLYTAIFPSFLYIFFGTSKHISLGGFAVLSLMTHAAIENVMVQQAKSYNHTQYVNHSITEFENLTEYEYNQTLLNSNWSDNETIIEAIITEKWTNGYMPVKPIQVATTITFLCGIIQLVLGVCQLEFLTNYFSDQVISGFVIGGCVHVFFAQVGDLLGIRLQRRTGPGYLYYRLKDLIMHLHETQIPTVAISVSSIMFLIFSKVVLAPWLSKVFLFPIPYELILAIVATTATNFADLSERYSISVVGNIPTEFPLPSLPRFDFITSIAQQSLGIAEIALAVHVTVAKIVESRYEYGIPCSQELRALGMAGLTSSFFPVFPVTSGFARSVVGTAAGGSTQLTSFFCALALLSVILYIGPALEYLPKCVLASMIIVSMKVYFEKFAELKKLWPVFKIDFVIWIVSMLLTICFDMAGGLAIAALFALLTTLFRNQRPKWYYLARNDKGHYQETKKKEIKYVNCETCIFRMDGPLIFTSVDRFITSLRKCVTNWRKIRAQRNYKFMTIEEMNEEAENYEKTKPEVKNNVFLRKDKKRNTGRPMEQLSLVIDCSGFPYVDYLGLATIKKVYAELMQYEVVVYLAEPRGVASVIAASTKLALFVNRLFLLRKFYVPYLARVMESFPGELLKMFEQTDFYETVDPHSVYAHLNEAVEAAERERKSENRTHRQTETDEVVLQDLNLNVNVIEY